MKNIIKSASREIHIDKSYVDYPETKYKKTFITNDGWNLLIKMIVDSDYNKNLSVVDYTFVMEAYNLIICCYLYQFLIDVDCPIDLDDIHLELKDKSKFLIKIEEDTYKEWQRYPGDWRTW